MFVSLLPLGFATVFAPRLVLQVAGAMSTGTDATDEELMLAYVEGDRAAFRVLFERFGPRIHRMVRRHVPSDDDARDLVQQTFLKLHGARHDFRTDAMLRPWLLTIAMNLLRERWRSAKRRKSVPVDDVELASDSRTSEPLETRLRRERVIAAVAVLPEAQREVIELHWFQELPFAEVAMIVGANEGAVRVRAHRAYERLKLSLGGEVGR